MKRSRSGVSIWLAAGLIPACAALGQEFSFQVASPVAAQSFHAKNSAFVFRTTGCSEPSKLDVRGTAEGLVRGERRSVPLKIAALQTPGVYAVFRDWPAEGAWAVSLSGRCATASAGALVAIGPTGFSREASKLLAGPATEPEVEAFLKSRTGK